MNDDVSPGGTTTTFSAGGTFGVCFFISAVLFVLTGIAAMTALHKQNGGAIGGFGSPQQPGMMPQPGVVPQPGQPGVVPQPGQPGVVPQPGQPGALPNVQALAARKTLRTSGAARAMIWFGAAAFAGFCFILFVSAGAAGWLYSSGYTYDGSVNAYRPVVSTVYSLKAVTCIEGNCLTYSGTTSTFRAAVAFLSMSAIICIPLTAIFLALAINSRKKDSAFAGPPIGGTLPLEHLALGLSCVLFLFGLIGMACGGGASNNLRDGSGGYGDNGPAMGAGAMAMLDVMLLILVTAGLTFAFPHSADGQPQPKVQQQYFATTAVPAVPGATAPQVPAATAAATATAATGLMAAEIYRSPALSLTAKPAAPATATAPDSAVAVAAAPAVETAAPAGAVADVESAASGAEATPTAATISESAAIASVSVAEAGEQAGDAAGAAAVPEKIISI